jgi:hypothetical protein
MVKASSEPVNRPTTINFKIAKQLKGIDPVNIYLSKVKNPPTACECILE